MVDGVPGKPGNTETWRFIPPLGNAKKNTNALLEQTEEALAIGNTDEAAAKLAVVLGEGRSDEVGDELGVVRHPVAYLNKGTEVAAKHPELAKDPAVARELARAAEIVQKRDRAYKEDFLAMQKMLELATMKDGKVTPGCAIIPSDLASRLRVGGRKNRKNPTQTGQKQLQNSRQGRC
jgi:hypothetical protein